MPSDATTVRPYRSDHRAEQARRTRARVLDAATQVFRDKGYAGTTMRSIGATAGLSLPTVELLFGTKARALKAAIDVAIAGDDEAVPVLDRDWAQQAAAAETATEFFELVASVIAPAQARSAGLILAVFEGSSVHPELAELATQLSSQRMRTAEWIVDVSSRKAPLRRELTGPTAAESLWVLMEPAVFDRAVRHLQWSPAQYQAWFAVSARNLLVADVSLEGLLS